MKITLAGIGWIDDCEPHGNRLRWTYPFVSKRKADEYLGLPDRFIVERTTLDEDLWVPPQVSAPDGAVLTGPWLAYPASWWSAPQNIYLTDVFTLYRFKSPVQAVRFTYHGPATRMRIKDIANNRTLLDQPITDNKFVCAVGGRIEEISFLSPAGTIHMENFAFLDLFAARALPWQTIAEIDVAGAIRPGVSLQEVAPRGGTLPILSAGQWQEFCDLVHQARQSVPVVEPPAPINMLAEPPVKKVEAFSFWETFEMVLSLRWQFACLLGFGCFDGPRREFCRLDRVDRSKILNKIAPKPVAYRVRCSGRTVEPSNIVVCPPYRAGALAAPNIPQYLNPEARLTNNGTIQATMRMEWVQHDFNAVGVEIEEKISASHMKKTPAQSRTFEVRSPDPEAALYSGSLDRRFEVGWHDVTLQACAKAIDSWDRGSSITAWTSPTPLQLCHQPFPPNLIAATYMNGKTTLQVEQGWSPDPIVQAAPHAKVFFYRRDPKQLLKTATITIGMPVPYGSAYKASFTPPPGFTPQDFEGGVLVAGQARLEITQIMADQVIFDLQVDAAGTVSAVPAGPAVLYQNPREESLWIKLHEVPIAGLGSTVQVSEPLPFPTAAADVLQYSARLAFLTRLGPFGNIASAVRIPTPPGVPPPFTVDLQGVDFYHRTLVQITLTQPVKNDALCRVWWALGDYTGKADAFSHQAVPGVYGPQTTQNGKVLFDLLPLPLDAATQALVTTVTIGVQQVNVSGGQSAFKLVKV